MRKPGWYWVRISNHHMWSVARYLDGEWTMKGEKVDSAKFLEIGFEFTVPPQASLVARARNDHRLTRLGIRGNMA